MIRLRTLRLATGLLLLAYVALHLANHALGNVSVAAMEAGLLAQKFLWQGAAGSVALYAAMTIHLLLGVWAAYQRRHVRWTRGEVTQFVLGLCIPPLLANHVIVTRVSWLLYGTEKGYAQELYSFWVTAPGLGAQQAVVLVVAWIHGCLGVHFWLRLKKHYATAAPYLLCAAVLLPVLALLGFYQGGRAVLAAAQDPAWRAANLTPGQVGLAEQNAVLTWYRDVSLQAGAGLVGLVLLARLRRSVAERGRRAILVSYPNGQTARVPRGFSVLEASRAARVPHAGVCGGRGRCSTCRVRVVAGAAGLPPPSAREKHVLERIKAGPAVRLACLLFPSDDVSVVPLLPAETGSAWVRAGSPVLRGEERFIVVLVVDMRNSTRLAELRMPFDAVFIVDRFIAAVVGAITRAGGRVNTFTGDGVMAAFGLQDAPKEACRQALQALPDIGEAVRALNAVLAREMAQPVQFGIGVHGSMAVVGEIGLGEARVFTTLGDAANTATRLEGLCKRFGCEAVLSDYVCWMSGLDLDFLPSYDVEVRGRSAPMAVRIAERTALLAGPVARRPAAISVP